MNTQINAARAREIAAQWQSPGTQGCGFAQYASTAKITDDLLDDIAREIRELERGVQLEALWAHANLADMQALRAFIDAEPVFVWSVGNNVAGYMPEGDVQTFLSWKEAYDAYEAMLKEAPDDWYSDGCDCPDEESCNDGCDAASLEAQLGAFLRDDAPRDGEGALLYLRPDYLPLPTAFWLTRNEMTVAAYRAEREI